MIRIAEKLGFQMGTLVEVNPSNAGIKKTTPRTTYIYLPKGRRQNINTNILPYRYKQGTSEQIENFSKNCNEMLPKSSITLEAKILRF